MTGTERIGFRARKRDISVICYQNLKDKCFFLHCAGWASWSWILLSIPCVPFSSVLSWICVRSEESCAGSQVCAAGAVWTLCFWKLCFGQVHSASAVKRFRISWLVHGAWSGVDHLPAQGCVQRPHCSLMMSTAGYCWHQEKEKELTEGCIFCSADRIEMKEWIDIMLLPLSGCICQVWRSQQVRAYHCHHFQSAPSLCKYAVQ